MQLGGFKETAQINVTPMIDILLVLLITFMILPSKTMGLKSDIPQPAPENQQPLPNPQNIVVSIRKDRSMQINSQPITLADLPDRLKSLFAVRPDGVLFVDGAGELEFADVVVVIDIARGVGVDRIGLMTAKLQ